jgi:hypothetical protein
MQANKRIRCKRTSLISSSQTSKAIVKNKSPSLVGLLALRSSYVR